MAGVVFVQQLVSKKKKASQLVHRRKATLRKDCGVKLISEVIPFRKSKASSHSVSCHI